MKQLTDILLIAAIYVFALDVSGFWQEATAAVKAWLTRGQFRTPIDIKPFSCSLCMTFWTGIVYLVFTDSLTLPLTAYVCLVAMLTPRIADLLHVVDNLLAKIFNQINKIL